MLSLTTKDTMNSDTLLRIYQTVINTNPIKLQPQSVYNAPRSRKL